MKMYKISYRKDEWVSVIAGFADGINIDDLDHVSLATNAVVSESLRNYESRESYHVSESSVEVDEIDEGTPDVVIGTDGSVLSGDNYELFKFAYFTDFEKDKSTDIAD